MEGLQILPCYFLLISTNIIGALNDHFTNNTSTSTEVQKPVFLEEPEREYYMVRNKPLKLQCKATHTERIIFKCDNFWMDPSLHNTSISEMVLNENERVKVAKTFIEITQSQLVFKDAYEVKTCECHAFLSSLQPLEALTVRSRPGEIKMAYMRRQFEREPLSTSVRLSSSLVLHCLPPRAAPPPDVIWMKDGVDIDVTKDTNLIISNEGNLIFTEVRLSDKGNYSCGALNLAARRNSEPAVVNVYVHGGWTQWSSWSECSLCPRSFKRRSRSCTQPQPLNEGNPCRGQGMQVVLCQGVCVDDDYMTGSSNGIPEEFSQWSEWSHWSACNPVDCQRHRRRLCQPPLRGSEMVEDGCHGTDVETLKCTSSVCVVSKNSAQDHTGMYVGVTLAVVSFFVCLIVSVFLIRLKKRSPPSPQTKLVSQIQDVYMAPEVTSSLIVQQSNSQNIFQQQMQQQQQQYGLLATSNKNYINNTLFNASPANNTMYNKFNNTYFANNNFNSSSDNSNNKNYTTDDENVCSESPYCKLTFPNETESENKCVTTQNTQSNYNNGPPQPSSLLSTPLHSSNPSSQYRLKVNPSSSSSSSSTTSSISKRPQSCLQNNGINNTLNNVFSHHFSQQPPLPPPNKPLFQQQQANHHYFPTGVGAVVWESFGPKGGRLTLEESDISMLVMNGSMDAEQEMFLAVSRDDKDRPKLSENQTLLSPVVLCGPKNTSLKKPIFLSFRHCACLKDSFWRIFLFASDAPYEVTPEWKLLCLVGSPEDNSSQPCVNLEQDKCHVITDHPLTMCALVGVPRSPSQPAIKALRLASFALQPSSPLTSLMDCSIRIYIVEDTVDALEGVMQIESLLGGIAVDQPRSIFFQHNASNMCFSVQNVSPGWRNKMDVDCQEIPFDHIWNNSKNGLHCSITLEKLPNGKGSNNPTSLTCDIMVYQKLLPNNPKVIKINCDFLLEPNTMKTLIESPNQKSIVSQNDGIPVSLHSQLCSLLDNEQHPNNWKSLATCLNLQSYIEYMETKESPTDILLSLWQAKDNTQSALNTLVNSLRSIGHFDAADIISRSMDPVIF